MAGPGSDTDVGPTSGRLPRAATDVDPVDATLLRLLASFVGGYVIGSIPIGRLVARQTAGIDIRLYGTGNPGASNVLRNVGPAAAGVVGLGSFLQGFAPAWVAQRLTASVPCRAAAGVGGVFGYAWPITGGPGGRAVGSATGALAALDPAGLVPLLSLYAVGACLRRPALFTLCGQLAFLAYVGATRKPRPVVRASLATLTVVVVKRLERVASDLESGHDLRIVIDSLVHDRRPGQKLVGRAGACTR